MRYRLLGPMEVDDVADDAILRRAKPRALLAILLLNANRPVSTDTLVAGLWGEEPPPTALGAVQNYVSHLRKALGRDVVVTRAPGYAIELVGEELDLQRFERLRAEAAAAVDVEVRAAKLREALALWRGPPLADLVYEPFADAEIRRLDELRLAAIEERVAADLELGRHAELIAELEPLVQENALREQLRGHLMVALYRSGRQAEALEGYRQARRILDDLGLEPSEELQRLERAILRHDPALDAPAAAPSPRPQPIAAGRRTVTVLFADVTGSTALGESLDPETLREVMSGFFAEVRSVIERHGGTVEKFAGDDVMAIFGIPVLHEDDALRAIRAADEMRVAVQTLDDELEHQRGVRFQLRIGVNTGEVVAGGASGGPYVTGPPVNLGKRLQELAEPGDIVLGASTLALVRDAVEAATLGEVAIRGKAERVEAFRLVRVVPDAAGVARAFDAPFVGRVDELAALRAALGAARTERRCRVVATIGDAGIGKTRIARELVSSIETDALVLVGRCVAYGTGATYLPLADALGDVREELEPLLAADEDGELVARRIDALLGAEETPASAAETAWAVRRAIELLARRRPLVLVFDDVHWAEPTFLDLVEYLAAWTDDAPLLVLALARPELFDARPTWADASSGIATLRIGPLAEEEMRSLVGSLASDSVTDLQRDRAATLAEGYPLFAEQLVAYVEETGDVELAAVPATLEALLASRLDRLDGDERAALERAAVVGRDFWRGAVAALSPENELAAVGRHLLALVRKGLLRPARSELPREDALRFHHALVRDVTYAGIPKTLRAELHERCAEWLERRAGEPDEVVGYHLEQAHRYRVELGPGDRAVRRLGAEAGERLGRAGVRALARGDSPAAVNLLARGSSVLPSADRLRIELLCELGVAHHLAGSLESAERRFEEALAEASTARDRRLELRARLELATVRLTGEHGRIDELLRLHEAGVPVFEALGDDRSLGRAWYASAFAHGSFLCRNASWEAAAERALVHYRQAGWPTTSCLQSLSAALFYGPHPVPDAIRRCDELLDREVTDRAGEAGVRVWRGALHALQAEFAAARSDIAVARQTFDELAQPINAAVVCDAVAGLTELLADDLESAESILRSSAAVLERRGLGAHLANRAAELADVLHEQERDAEAAEWAAVARGHASDHDTSAQFTWRGVLAKVEARAGRAAEGERLAREALALVDTTDATSQRADIRVAYSEVLAVAGKVEEAATVTNEALRLYEEKGNAAGARRAARAVARVAQM